MSAMAASLFGGSVGPVAAGPAGQLRAEQRPGALWIWPADEPGPGPAVAFDLDGVLSDGSARRHHLSGSKPDWEAFLAGVGDDPPIEETARLLSLLDPSLAVVLLTGRPARVGRVTLDWLSLHQLRWDLMVMRLDGDYRPAAVFKQEAVRALRASGLDIRLYFEDDKRTVELLRTEGLPTLYVHSGYYD